MAARAPAPATAGERIGAVGHGQAPMDPGTAPVARNETPLERLDRNLIELLSELRVVLPGVQVLFAFLLVLPFNNGWKPAAGLERGVYFATLLLAALASACLIAPSAHHSFLFRCDDKEHVVLVSHRLTIARLVFLSAAIEGALLLVTIRLFGVAAGVVTVAAMAGPFGVLWFSMPLARRRRLGRAGWTPDTSCPPSPHGHAPS